MQLGKRSWMALWRSSGAIQLPSCPVTPFIRSGIASFFLGVTTNVLLSTRATSAGSVRANQLMEITFVNYHNLWIVKTYDRKMVSQNTRHTNFPFLVGILVCLVGASVESVSNSPVQIHYICEPELVDRVWRNPQRNCEPRKFWILSFEKCIWRITKYLVTLLGRDFASAASMMLNERLKVADGRRHPFVWAVTKFELQVKWKFDH